MEGLNTGPVDIKKLFTDVVDKGIAHCRICYRTSREVKLVQPEKLLQLTSHLKQQYVFGSAALDKSACIICEGAAAASLRLTDAIFNAATIKGIMQTYSGYFVKKSVATHTHVVPFEKLIAYRDRTTYKQTEVLIVDSLGLEWSNKGDGTDKGPTRVDLTDVMRDNPPTIETVVLDDDDDSKNVNTTPAPESDFFTIINNPIQMPEPTPIPEAADITVIQIPKLVPIDYLLNNVVEKTKYAAMVPNKMQLITGHHSAGDNFVLHEVIMQKDGTLTVPGLACEMKNGRLTYNPNLLDAYHMLQNAMNNTFKSTTTPGSINNTVQTDKSTNFPESTSTDANKRKMIPTNKSNNDIKKHKVVRNETKNGRFLGTQSLSNTKFNTDSKDANCISIIDVKGSVADFDSPAIDTIEMVEIDSLLRKAINETKRTDTNKKPQNEPANWNKLIGKRITEISKKPQKELVVNLNLNNCLRGDIGEVMAVISDVKSQAQAEPAAEGAAGPEQGIAEKRPIEKGGRIDWEDKIPMDVISYMDATDPNAELIVPDSLPREPQAVKQEADVIDLC